MGVKQYTCMLMELIQQREKKMTLLTGKTDENCRVKALNEYIHEWWVHTGQLDFSGRDGEQPK